MKSSAPQRSQNAVRHRVKLRISPTAAACSALLFAMSAAYAQDATAPAAGTANLDTVTVTGIRRGIESAIAVKRNSDSIVEAVSSEDIGKLPDVSIAESLARLPGLAAQRVDGRAQEISIRGLGPDYSTALLNGREQVSTGDNRAVEFDQYPSELMSGAIVYKTPDAKLVGQGLAGTVNLTTVRPLDFATRQIAVNVRGEQNSNGSLIPGISATGDRESFAYIDQFANRTIGVSIGIAHMTTPLQEKHYKAWWWDTAWDPTPGLSGVVPTSAALLGGFEVAAIAGVEKRNGLMTTVEYKPSKDFHSTVDLYYSTKDTSKTSSYLIANNPNHWGGGNYSNATASGNVINNVTISNLSGMLVQSDLNTQASKLGSLGWNNELKLDNKWTAIADLSYSGMHRQDNNWESTAATNQWMANGAQNVNDTVSYNIPGGPGMPIIHTGVNYANPNTIQLVNPGWGRAGFHENPYVTDELKAIRLEAKRSLDGFFSDFATQEDAHLERVLLPVARWKQCAAVGSRKHAAGTCQFELCRCVRCLDVQHPQHVEHLHDAPTEHRRQLLWQELVDR